MKSEFCEPFSMKSEGWGDGGEAENWHDDLTYVFLPRSLMAVAANFLYYLAVGTPFGKGSAAEV
jgi:hypothetical protein